MHYRLTWPEESADGQPEDVNHNLVLDGSTLQGDPLVIYRKDYCQSRNMYCHQDEGYDVLPVSPQKIWYEMKMEGIVSRMEMLLDGPEYISTSDSGDIRNIPRRWCGGPDFEEALFWSQWKPDFWSGDSGWNRQLAIPGWKLSQGRPCQPHPQNFKAMTCFWSDVPLLS